jgi:hypothetical protein
MFKTKPNEFGIPQIIERNCGNCTLCCFLPEIGDRGFEKPIFTNCKFCKVGKGCTNYESRAQGCKDFSCMWKMTALHESSRPDKTGIMIDLWPMNNGSKSGHSFAIWESKVGVFKRNRKKFEEAVNFCVNYYDFKYPIILVRPNNVRTIYVHNSQSSPIKVGEKIMMDGKETIARCVDDILTDIEN